MTASDTIVQEAPVERACGWTLVVAGVASVVGMMYHPSASSHGAASIHEIAGEGGLASVVHGFLMVAGGALVFGFSGLSARLGWARAAPRAAFIAYALAAVAMLAAAVINGFAVNRIAQTFVAAGPEDFASARASLDVLRAMSSTWAQVGAGGQAIALVLWSVALWPANRAPAGLALLAAIPAAAGATGFLPLNVHGYLAVVAMQAIWTVAVGRQLIKGRI